MTRHDCPGIRPQPLGSYLAGLGLVRLIGEQADPAATARWGDDGLVTEPVHINVPVKFPDGWEANHSMMAHLANWRLLAW